MTVIGLVETSERFSAGQPLNGLHLAIRAYHYQVGDSALDAHVGVIVVVRLDQTHMTARSNAANTTERNQLSSLDGRPAALVLPAAYLDDDVHPGSLLGHGQGTAQGSVDSSPVSPDGSLEGSSSCPSRSRWSSGVT